MELCYKLHELFYIISKRQAIIHTTVWLNTMHMYDSYGKCLRCTVNQ